MMAGARNEEGNSDEKVMEKREWSIKGTSDANGILLADFEHSSW
jgi:hypothetical protein